jgi:NADPH:quinone reductase-like Zn-dependent oxidoreductase
MKAWTKYKYGGPQILQLEEIENSKVKEGNILVRIKANAIATFAICNLIVIE